MNDADEERLSNMLDVTNSNVDSIQKETSVMNQGHTKRVDPKAERERLYIPKGKPKSGRIWKEQKTKFSSIIKTRGIRLSLTKKQKLREDLKRVKDMSRAIKLQKQEEKEAKKQRRIENLKRAEENRKKSEIVQVITNTAKIKRMRKKQLRMIEKRDITNVQRTV
ncbi:coiled-coil domain-containing protein 86 [Odontomachus brunneus]|uniref:coiled-coil domain-containing protein 86 n=1 Tax=Odontomachus brunneus TaxID=486640 RepID=UPI0013F232E6|nr:coiled-coil domain-containing protein 86 [Odontomachus brunneus]XP_032691560.1 coiled-coil domain-containing protein 86 [Odontomachus brunneus]